MAGATQIDARTPARGIVGKLRACVIELAPFMEEHPDEVEITSLRDRAYTALWTAMLQLRGLDVASGVYPLDGFSPLATPVRTA